MGTLEDLEAMRPLTGKIIGCAIEVHRALGPGLLEPLYERALAIEFDERGILYVRQARLPAFYKGHALGTYRVDFIVEDRVLLEIKSVTALTPVFDAQVLSYLRLTGKRVALLMNFNEAVLKNGIRRLLL